MKKLVKNAVKRSKISKIVSSYKFKILIPAVLVFGGIFGFIKAQQVVNISEIGTPIAAIARAVQLDGNNFIEVNDSSTINPNFNDGFVVEAWVKPQDATYSGMYIVDKSSGNTSSYSLRTDAGFNSGEGKYHVNYYFNVATQGCAGYYTIFNQLTYTDPTEVSAWHHIAGVVHPGGKLDIFVDGQKSTMNTNQVPSVCMTESSPVRIGARVAGTPNGNFRVLIDEVHVAGYGKYTENFTPSKYSLSPVPPTSLLFHFDNNLANVYENSRYGIARSVVSFANSLIQTIYEPGSSPTDAPIPSPSPTPYCYTTGRMCIAREGQVCPSPWTVCTSPTPTPVPSIKPSPSPVPVCTPSTSCNVSGCMAKRDCTGKYKGTVASKCNRIGTRVKCRICTTKTCPTPVPMPSPTPYRCTGSLSDVRYGLSCSDVNTALRNSITFKCIGNTKDFTLGGSTSCKSVDTWKIEATQYCKSNVACYPIPSATASSTSMPKTTPIPPPPIY